MIPDEEMVVMGLHANCVGVLRNISMGEWGGKMQDDLTDGLKWLERQGIADPDRVCIVGGSYGGYATLAGLTKKKPAKAAR